jgi:hypothetical protein
MSVKERSFWSTTAGVVTGVAGIVTALAGLLGVAAQQGWLNSKSNDHSTTTVTTVQPSGDNPVVGGSAGSSGSGASGSGRSSSTPLFDVVPSQVTFDKLGPRDKQLTIRNLGTTAFTLPLPTVQGPDASRFTVTDATCGGRLDASRSCEVKVTFNPNKAGDFTARLVVQPTNAPTARDVPIQASALL